MIIHNPILTGSFTVNGTDVSSITSSAASLTAINSYTASQNILNGTYTLTSSFAAQTASFTAFTASVNSFTASQLVLNGTYATTGSNTFAGIQTVNSNLVVTGSITAQTLVVQTVTSSVVYSSGSNVFGNDIANTQVFTGSMSLTGSLTVVTTGTEFQVTSTGVRIGNVIGDAHNITGSVGISGSATFVSTVTATGFEVGNGQFYRARRTSSNLLTDMIGIPNGTDDVRVLTTGAFNVINGALSTMFGIASNGAATFSSTVTSKGLVVVGASGGYTTGDNTYINLGGSASPDTFGAINAPFGDVMKFNSYHGYQFKTSNSTASPVTMFSIGINGAATFSATTTFNSTVGIGTSSPLGPLEVRAANRLVSNDGILQINTTNSQAADLGGSLSFGGRWDVGATPTEWAQISGRKENSNTNEYGGYLSFATRPHGGVNTERIRITSAGVVSINSSGGEANAGLDRFTMGYFVSNYGWMQTWASTPLYLNRLGNNVSAFGSAGFGLITTTSSDVRIKKNIVSIESALDKVNALRGVYFEFDKNNELEVSVPHGKTRVGLIAQEVETIIPEAVIDGDNDGTPKSVDYTGLVGVLVKAIQELKAEFDAYKATHP
jgi:hypothetical protein